MPLRVALGLLLTAATCLLYTFSTVPGFAVSSGSAMQQKEHHAVNSGLEYGNMRLGGRWQVLYDLSDESDTPSNGVNSLYDLAHEPIPTVHGSELRKRDSMEAPPYQPLHFSFDSQDEAQGRDVSMSQEDLLDMFRSLARKEREETRRRVGGKSKLRDRELQLTVTA